MGDARRYSCECGYEAELWIGCGFMSWNIDTIKQCIPEEGFAPFNETYSAGGVSDFCLETVIARCKSCKEIVPVNVLSYTLNDSPKAAPNRKKPSTRQVRYICACPLCGGKVNEEKDIERIRCPKCRGKMYYQNTGMWD